MGACQSAVGAMNPAAAAALESQVIKKVWEVPKSDAKVKVLVIETSPRIERSHSSAVAREFVTEYKKLYPDHLIVSINLYDPKRPMPELNEARLNGKYNIMSGKSNSDEEKKIWGDVEAVIAFFKSFDRILITSAMHNFSVTYKLKHFIDIVSQPTYTFSFSPDKGYSGLMGGKDLAFVLAAGGNYPNDSPMNHQEAYLNAWAGFLGFQNPAKIRVLGTLTPDAQKSKDAAIAEAKALAADWGKKPVAAAAPEAKTEAKK